MSPRPPAPGHRPTDEHLDDHGEGLIPRQIITNLPGSRAATFCDSWTLATQTCGGHQRACTDALTAESTRGRYRRQRLTRPVPQPPFRKLAAGAGIPFAAAAVCAPRRSYAPSCSIILPVGAMVSSLREGCESVEDSSASPISPSLQSPRQLCGSVAPPSPITGVIGSGGSEIGPAGPDRSPSPQQRLRPSTLSCRDRRPALITASAHRSTAGAHGGPPYVMECVVEHVQPRVCARSAPYDAERVQRAGGVARDVEGVAIGGDDRAAGSAGRGDRGSDLQRGQVDH